MRSLVACSRKAQRIQSENSMSTRSRSLFAFQALTHNSLSSGVSLVVTLEPNLMALPFRDIQKAYGSLYVIARQFTNVYSYTTAHCSGKRAP